VFARSACVHAPQSVYIQLLSRSCLQWLITRAAQWREMIDWLSKARLTSHQHNTGHTATRNTLQVNKKYKYETHLQYNVRPVSIVQHGLALSITDEVGLPTNSPSQFDDWIRYQSQSQHASFHLWTFDTTSSTLLLTTASGGFRHVQGRINHCAGCNMAGGPAAMGPPINCQIFTTLFWRLNVESV